MRPITALLAGCVLALALLGVAAAGTLEDGETAYERGDYAAAISSWRPLAEQGDAAAQFNLGRMYALGEGVPQDYGQAVIWFRKAAGQGRADVQFSLGLIYEQGQGVTQDYAQAVIWYRKAAEQGNADAQFRLSLMYGTGHGVPQDYVQAHMWANLAAASPEVGTERQRYINLRDLTALLMTPDQIAEAQRLAREWTPK